MDCDANCATLDAVMKYTSAKIDALARKVVWRLQRIRANGVYGDDRRHRTLWDEYCHEVQHGPYELLGKAWEHTVTTVLDDAVDLVPDYELVLLTVGAGWVIEGQELSLNDQGNIAPCHDLVRRYLSDAVRSLAGARDMSRFEP